MSTWKEEQKAKAINVMDSFKAIEGVSAKVVENDSWFSVLISVEGYEMEVSSTDSPSVRLYSTNRRFLHCGTFRESKELASTQPNKIGIKAVTLRKIKEHLEYNRLADAEWQIEKNKQEKSRLLAAKIFDENKKGASYSYDPREEGNSWKKEYQIRKGDHVELVINFNTADVELKVSAYSEDAVELFKKL